MKYSENYNFYLPSRDSDDVADINQISENFRIIDGKMFFLERTQLQTAQDIEGLGRDLGDKIDETEAKEVFASAIRNTVSGNGIPLPDISPIEHTLVVKARSKNLILYPYEFSSPNANNGITFTDNGDGTISLNGATSTNYASCVLATGLKILANTEYTLSGGFQNCYVILTAHDKTSGAWKADICSVMGTAKTFTITEEIASSCYLRAYLRVIAGATVNRGTAYPMLEKGTFKTPFTPFVDVSTAKVIVNDTITYPINADGTVEGVTSIYPLTIIGSDTPSVILDVEYNADTKKYIDSKFAELAALIVNS